MFSFVWNNHGLVNKVTDTDFLNDIDKYDLLLFTETWHAKSSVIKIPGYDCFSCTRSKENKKAKDTVAG